MQFTSKPGRLPYSAQRVPSVCCCDWRMRSHARKAVRGLPQETLNLVFLALVSSSCLCPATCMNDDPSQYSEQHADLSGTIPVLPLFPPTITTSISRLPSHFFSLSLSGWISDLPPLLWACRSSRFPSEGTRQRAHAWWQQAGYTAMSLPIAPFLPRRSEKVQGHISARQANLLRDREKKWERRGGRGQKGSSSRSCKLPLKLLGLRWAWLVLIHSASWPSKAY